MVRNASVGSRAVKTGLRKSQVRGGRNGGLSGRGGESAVGVHRLTVAVTDGKTMYADERSAMLEHMSPQMAVQARSSCLRTGSGD